LEDLLRAYVEVLGNGTFGIVYNAALEDATTVVAKRLKDFIVRKWSLNNRWRWSGGLGTIMWLL